MNINIRKVKKSEYKQTEYLTRETFWNLYQPGCSEHLILHNHRKSKDYVEELDLVLLQGTMIIGHIIAIRAEIVDHNGSTNEALLVGPVSIRQNQQSQGWGTQLINHLIVVAKEMGYSGMLLYGNPDYYRRFGFKNAGDFEITTEDGKNFDAFMALELSKASLNAIKGRFLMNKSIKYSKEELEEFDQKFPQKEKKAPKININA